MDTVTPIRDWIIIHLLNSLAIGLAAAQAAVFNLTPILSIKMGRKGGPAEFAEVGDIGVHE
jgi:hypothetical protein